MHMYAPSVLMLGMHTDPRPHFIVGGHCKKLSGLFDAGNWAPGTGDFGPGCFGAEAEFAAPGGTH